MNQELIQYLQKQIRTVEDRLYKYTHNTQGGKLPQRFLFVKIQKYLNDFLGKISENRLIIIPGLRGVGKTTLMAQICSDLIVNKKNVKTLFLSLDEVKNLFNVGISEVMQAYEEILGEDLESLSENVVIFFDEVQSDPTWAKALKILHDKTSKIFFCCTGSSAVVLQSTPDIARGRAIFERMTPMCFMEFEMVKDKVFPTKQLKKDIWDAVYFSKDAVEVYDKLSKLQSLVNNYWSKVDRRDMEKFLAYGSLPFTLQLPNETIINDSISLLLDGIIKKDLPMLNGFDVKTLSQVKRLLFILAENDTTSINKLEEILGIDRLTIASLLDALEKAELIIKISAYGSNMSVAKKPAKYLFMSSAVRMSFFSISGNENTFSTRKGKLLEDSVGTHLYREFILKNDGALRYDSSQNGADFILQIANKKQIIIEVGLGKKDRKQILNSMERIDSDYGIVFSSNPLVIDQDKKIVNVPLDYYFLM
ncbi:MAG TPA: ATP-binding protein [Candidatus Magasanikbacteria bacterium]|nr:ATP-binding protein [Candidatus Magasanikbacteria bacterium]